MGKFGEKGVGFEFWKGGMDRKEYRHEDGERKEEGGNFGGGAVKFEILEDGGLNRDEKRRCARWAAGVFMTVYVDGRAGVGS